MKNNDENGAGGGVLSAEVLPVPEFICCPLCGADIELWSDELLTRCLFCGHNVFKKERIIH